MGGRPSHDKCVIHHPVGSKVSGGFTSSTLGYFLTRPPSCKIKRDIKKHNIGHVRTFTTVTNWIKHDILFNWTKYKYCRQCSLK